MVESPRGEEAEVEEGAKREGWEREGMEPVLLCRNRWVGGWMTEWMNARTSWRVVWVDEKGIDE